MKPVTKEAFAFLFAAVVVIFSRSTVAATPYGETLDDKSVKCLSCHSSTASEHYRLSVCSADDICDHPVGGVYDALASGNRSIKPAADIDHAVKLGNGRIVCVTCHVRYYSADEHRRRMKLRKRYPLVPDPMLVVDNRDGLLCRACHLKK